jgi:cell division protein FtsX
LRFGQLSKFIEGDLLTKLEQLNGKIGKIGNDPLMDVDKVVKRNEPDVKNAKKKIENWRKVKKLEEVESKEEEFFDVAKIVG